MAKVELIIPDKFSKIDPELREKLLSGALREVVSVQLKEKEKKLEEIREHILKFEKKYKKSFKDFEKELPKDAGHELHVDLVEWSFWNDVYETLY